jgi:SepF-like predicted cell division protein (DUF552 family)
MPLLKKPFGRAKEEIQTIETDQYIDLGQLSFDETNPLQGKGMVKYAEIYRYEDLSAVTQPVYNGNILLIDYSALSNDSLTLKRITNELKAVSRDINGEHHRRHSEWYKSGQTEDQGRLHIGRSAACRFSANPIYCSSLIAECSETIIINRSAIIFTRCLASRSYMMAFTAA